MRDNPLLADVHLCIHLQEDVLKSTLNYLRILIAPKTRARVHKSTSNSKIQFHLFFPPLVYGIFSSSSDQHHFVCSLASKFECPSLKCVDDNNYDGFFQFGIFINTVRWGCGYLSTKLLLNQLDMVTGESAKYFVMEFSCRLTYLSISR